MVKSPWITGLLCITLLSVAADSVEDALQAGYRAFLNKEFETAIAHYEQAMKHSTDPGRIACDLGSILAQAERYQDAALFFTRSLEDAQGLRRAKAAYGQATAFTHMATQLKGRRAVNLLQRALQSYEIALREITSLGAQEQSTLGNLHADSEHNRKLAQALLAQKLKEPEPPDSSALDEPDEMLDPRLTDPTAGGGTGRGATPLSGRPNTAQGNETGTSESAAGRGNLPPLPDEDQVTPLSADEAHRRLDQLMQRLRQPLHRQPTKPGTRDW